MLRTSEHAIRRLTTVIGQTVAWLTALMAAVTTAVVIARHLGWGSIAAQESVLYMHALVLALAAAYTLNEGGHVRVDIFYRHFSAAQQAWVNALGTALFLIPLTLFILLISWEYVLQAWRIREASVDAGGIPAVFILKSLIWVNALLLLLQAIAELMGSLRTLTYAKT